MANPRQRRKQRSGNSNLSISKQSKKNMKKFVLKGVRAESIREGWDPHLTLRQNYAKLGLMPSSNPKLAGGIEKTLTPKLSVANDIQNFMEQGSDDESEVEMQEDTEELNQESAKLGPNQARIIKDSNGKVIGFVMGDEDGNEVMETVEEIKREKDEVDEDEDEDESDEAEDDRHVIKRKDSEKTGTPWGAPMKPAEFEKKVNPKVSRQTGGHGISYNTQVHPVEAKTEAVKELERLAQESAPVLRFTSNNEMDWLLSMVATYDEDVERMSRDRKVNPWQRTPGEIAKMIKKAGGFSKLKARLSRS